MIQAKQAGTEAEVNRGCFQLNVSFLQMDMTQRHGVDTAVEGVCATCSKPIPAKVVWGGSGTRNTLHICDMKLYTLNNSTQCLPHTLYIPRRHTCVCRRLSVLGFWIFRHTYVWRRLSVFRLWISSRRQTYLMSGEGFQSLGFWISSHRQTAVYTTPLKLCLLNNSMLPNCCLHYGQISHDNR